MDKSTDTCVEIDHGDPAAGYSLADAQDARLTETLRRAGAGDPAAWRELVAGYGRRVFALVFSRCRRNDLAEDVTQSVFVTLSQKLKAAEYEEQGRFEAWLFRIAINRLRDALRRERRRGEVGGDAFELRLAEGGGPAAREEGGRESDAGTRLRSALESLSEADRDVIELRHHGGLSFKQMADVLDEPLGTLLARHHRALKKLKEMLERQGVTGMEAMR